MSIRPLDVRIEGPEAFEDHGRIPIAFDIGSRVDLEVLAATEGQRVVGYLCEPRVKNYDDEPCERPSEYARLYDVSRWRTVAAFIGDERVGGAVLARSTSGFRLLEGTNTAGLIVDIRVQPALRGQGIGRILIESAARQALADGCDALRVETQDTNIGACRLYSAAGFRVFLIDRLAYGPCIDETLIGWQRSL